MTFDLSNRLQRAAERQAQHAQDQHLRIRLLEDALAEIEAKAPTCMPDTEAMTVQDWRHLCRDMQTIARLARKGIDRKGRKRQEEDA